MPRWRPQPVTGLGTLVSVSRGPSLPPLAQIDPADWQVIVTTASNVVVHGTPAVCDVVVSALQPSLGGPVRRWQPEAERPLPDGSTGTLIVEQVPSCSPAQQEALLAWLDEAGRDVRIVCTAQQPMRDLVRHGFFLARLYYRLNTVYLDLSAAPPAR